MKLLSIKIKNYRSIESLELKTLEGVTSVFVGINESGKSNILKAINLLSGESEISKRDRRMTANPDHVIDESFVKYIFALNREESEETYRALTANTVHGNANEKIVQNGTHGPQLLRDLIFSQNLVIYNADLIKTERYFSRFLFPKSTTILDGWGYVDKKNLPDGAMIAVTGDSSLLTPKMRPAKDVEMVDLTAISNADEPWIKPLTIEILQSIIFKYQVEACKDLLPDVLFWRFDDKNLLPSEIDIESFAKNPSICAPLKTLFELSGVVNLEEEILEARSISPQKFKSVLKRVSSTATKYLREVWTDYQNVKFEITPAGNTMTISVSDEDTEFSYEDRSDGFKRFVSFLLLVSARVKNNQIRNTVLIFDEPEISLHPSGVRNLRDELIRIGRANNVFIATHSPYMINQDCYEANYVVKKAGEITHIPKEQGDSALYEDEVLYRAMGASVFDVISNQNILFEGWQDKKFFELYLRNQSEELKKQFYGVGLCHSYGAKGIKSLAPIFQVAKRGLLILSDSDAPSIQYQREHQGNNTYGSWFTYSDIYNGKLPSAPETLEDFFTQSYFNAKLNSLNGRCGNMITFSEGDISDVKRLEELKSIMHKQKIQRSEVENFLKLLKQDLLDNYSYPDIDKKYDVVLEYIKTKL